MINDPYIHHHEWQKKLNEGHCCKSLEIAIKYGLIHVNQHKNDLYYGVEIKQSQTSVSVRIHECPFCHKKLPKMIQIDNSLINSIILYKIDGL